MEVISTRGRGAKTYYLVKEGETTREIERNNLPGDVFKRWRNHQAARCMARKRAEAKGQQPEQSQNVDTASSSRPLDLTRASRESEALEQNRQVDEAAQRALNMIMCKICRDEEVKKILLPCGHLVLCSRCLTKEMSQRNVCPLCREPIKDHIGVIMVE